MFNFEYQLNFLNLSLSSFFTDAAAVHAAQIGEYPIKQKEQELIGNAVSIRQQEFSTGRWCARKALSSINYSTDPIGIGKLMEPLWPEGIIGSISHDANVCAAVVVPSLKVSWMNIGFDIIGLKSRSKVLKALEHLFVNNHQELDSIALFARQIEPAILLFSVKESAVKALSSHVGEFMDMCQIEVIIEHNIVYLRYLDELFAVELFIRHTELLLLTAIKVLHSVNTLDQNIR